MKTNRQGYRIIEFDGTKRTKTEPGHSETTPCEGTLVEWEAWE